MRQPVTCRLDLELVEQVRDACWAVGKGYSLTGCIEAGLRHVLADMERQHNGGKPFAKREGELPQRPHAADKPKKK